MTTWNLQSAVVPVTGAASGIGFAICKRLRAEGATPLLLDLDVELLRSVAGGIYQGAAGAAHHAYALDVQDSAAVDTCLEWIRDTLPGASGASPTS